MRPAAALLAALVLLPGCGEGGRGVEVTIGDRSLVADRASVPAGEVTFTARNAGRADHELLVVRTELPVDRLGDLRFAGRYVLGAPHDHFAEAAGALRSRHIRPGRARREAVVLAPGDYVLLCGLPGHYASGQRAALRVL